MLTIALATFIYTVLVSVPASMDRVIKDASGTLRLFVVNKTAPWEDLPARYCDQIDKMPGAAACVGITGWFATWRDVSDPILAFGAGPEIADVFPDYQLSRENQVRTARERRAATVGSVLMKKNGWKLGDHITLRGTDAGHMQMDFVIIGTIENKRYPNTFLFRRDYLMESRKAAGLPDEDIAWNIIVRAGSAADLQPLAKNIDEHFTNSDYETRTLTESDAVASGLSALGNIRGIVFALCAVVVLTVLLIAANSTAMMVRERISEVAVMRSLGFSRGAISVLLFGECGLIGAVGGARRREPRALEVSRWSHARRGAGRQRRAMGDAGSGAQRGPRGGRGQPRQRVGADHRGAADLACDGFPQGQSDASILVGEDLAKNRSDHWVIWLRLVFFTLPRVGLFLHFSPIHTGDSTSSRGLRGAASCPANRQ